jgi:uncharacterized membrane protein
MWQNKADIPSWMPWITSVTVQPEDARMSKWLLSTTQFGLQLEFSWLARDLTPVPLQKIHWVSAGGLPNRGAVTFFPRGPDAGGTSCAIQLSISYELPEASCRAASPVAAGSHTPTQVLLPVGNSVRPVVESILVAGAYLQSRMPFMAEKPDQICSDL